jgi:hypothetical protein
VAETGRVIVVVRDGYEAQACADAIAESDATLQIDRVLDTIGSVIVARP